MKVTQSPMRPSAAKQQRQVTAPPKPPNNPPSPAAPARSGGGAGILKYNDYLVCLYEKKKLRRHLLCFVHDLTVRWRTI